MKDYSALIYNMTCFPFLWHNTCSHWLTLTGTYQDLPEGKHKRLVLQIVGALQPKSCTITNCNQSLLVHITYFSQKLISPVSYDNRQYSTLHKWNPVIGASETTHFLLIKQIKFCAYKIHWSFFVKIVNKPEVSDDFMFKLTKCLILRDSWIINYRNTLCVSEYMGAYVNAYRLL